MCLFPSQPAPRSLPSPKAATHCRGKATFSSSFSPNSSCLPKAAFLQFFLLHSIVHRPPPKTRVFLGERKETMAILIPKKMGPEAEMEEEAESKRELPMEILEAIVAKIPFPSLFKARVLSNSWYSKFTDSSDEASAFLSQVSANSASWKTYAPVFMSWSDMSVLAFDDRSNSQWFAALPPNLLRDIEQNERLDRGTSVCFIGSRVLRMNRRYSDWHLGAVLRMERRSPVWFAGALVLLVEPDNEAIRFSIGKRFSVGNVVTGSVRHLPSPPHLGYTFGRVVPGLSILIAVGCHSYKVLSMCTVMLSEGISEEIGEGIAEGINVCKRTLCVHVYDSNSHVWTSSLKKFSEEHILNGLVKFFDENCAFMDGKVYFLGRSLGAMLEGLKLVSYDLEDTAWTTVVESSNLGNTGWTIAVEGFADVLRPWVHSDSGVFRCGDKIIVVVMCGKAMFVRKLKDVEEGLCTLNIREKSIQVFQLDNQSLELVSISDGPPEITVPVEIFKFNLNPKLTADANFVYFGWDCLPCSIVKFDLNSREWSSIPLASSTPDFKWKLHPQIDWIHGVFEPGLNPFVVV